MASFQCFFVNIKKAKSVKVVFIINKKEYLQGILRQCKVDLFGTCFSLKITANCPNSLIWYDYCCQLDKNDII